MSACIKIVDGRGCLVLPKTWVGREVRIETLTSTTTHIYQVEFIFDGHTRQISAQGRVALGRSRAGEVVSLREVNGGCVEIIRQVLADAPLTNAELIDYWVGKEHEARNNQDDPGCDEALRQQELLKF